MIGILYSFLFSFVFVSCSSSSENSEFLTNQDFIHSYPKTFNKNEDLFPQEFSHQSPFYQESMDRAPVGQLGYFNSSEDPLERALSFCYRKKFPEANRILKKLYYHYEKNASYWNQVGTCEALRGNLKAALIFYNKSKDLRSDYAPPINNQGVLYQMEGKDQKALEAYKRASKISPFSHIPLFNQARLYAKYGFIKKAKKILNSFYQKNKDDEEVLSLMGYIHLIEGDYKAAVHFYSRMDEVGSLDFGAGLNLALSYYLVGNKDEAIDIWEDIEKPKKEEEKGYYKKVAEFIGVNQ